MKPLSIFKRVAFVAFFVFSFSSFADDINWLEEGKLTNQAKELISVIESSDEEGLSPKLYNIDGIKSGLEKLKESVLEKLLTQSYLTLATNYKYGVLDPYSYSKNKVREKEFQPLLKEAFSSNSIGQSLKSLLPQDQRYQALKKYYAEYKKKYSEAVWPKVSKGEKIKVGDLDPVRVKELRERLKASGELKKILADDVFDEELAESLKKFQLNHGLLDDGVLGDYTVSQLNVSPQERICQIAANLDRLRGYLKDLEAPKYIYVNVPDFYAWLVVDGKLEWESKAIVGRLDRKTPLMKDEMEYIVFSPKWHVPAKIAVEDKIPEIIKDPEFIKKNNMKVFETVEGEIKEVDPANVNWADVNKENYQYTIIQDAGDANALGRIKFMFPNKDDVYLHDTPTKKLFESMTRNFSSGCIRVQKPVELAEYLLKDKEGWNEEKIVKEMHRSSELFVDLKEHIPVRIIYLTSWVDSNGELQFRRDLYNFDKQYKKYTCNAPNVK